MPACLGYRYVLGTFLSRSVPVPVPFWIPLRFPLGPAPFLLRFPVLILCPFRSRSFSHPAPILVPLPFPFRHSGPFLMSPLSRSMVHSRPCVVPVINLAPFRSVSAPFQFDSGSVPVPFGSFRVNNLVLSSFYWHTSSYEMERCSIVDNGCVTVVGRNRGWWIYVIVRSKYHNSLLVIARHLLVIDSSTSERSVPLANQCTSCWTDNRNRII